MLNGTGSVLCVMVGTSPPPGLVGRVPSGPPIMVEVGMGSCVVAGTVGGALGGPVGAPVVAPVEEPVAVTPPSVVAVEPSVGTPVVTDVPAEAVGIPAPNLTS